MSSDEMAKGLRRLVPRISLLSFLLLSTLICVSVSHYRLMQENKALKQRNDDLRREIGYLVIDDRNKIYVRQLESFEELTWRFRIYLPKKTGYALHIRASNTSWNSMGLNPRESEFPLTVALRRQASGEWRLNWTIPQSSGSNGADKQIAERFWQSNNFVSMRSEQKEHGPQMPVDLIGNAKSDLHIWIKPSSNMPK
jgi:hypothetical protein